MSRLADLVREIESAPGGVTIGELAGRLDATPAAVSAMLDALRASGGLRRCGCVEVCATSCPGPAGCPFIVDVGTTLEVRRMR